ncbi:MAG: hypothetical protein HY941_12995 [Gammaproteobacteria bacterium]|nr:hypothetical protein [Gammaproteobacteria bacterium]
MMVTQSNQPKRKTSRRKSIRNFTQIPPCTQQTFPRLQHKTYSLACYHEARFTDRTRFSGMHPSSRVIEFLRLSPEPHRHVSEREIHALLSDRPADYLAFMRTRLEALASGALELELPPKQLFTDPQRTGDFRVMPCVTRDPDSVTKTVKLVGTNLIQHEVPDQITVGRAFALHPRENFVTHTFEACLLSSARTGACAALARTLLAPQIRSLGIVGAGRVGWYAAVYTCASQPPQELRFCDRDKSRAETAARLLRELYPDINVVATDLATTCAVDTLILATTARESIVSPQDTTATLTISLGADTDDQRELDNAWATAAEIYIDTQDSARFGDLHRWVDAGLLDSTRLTDMFSLLRSPVAQNPTNRQVFVSTGSALFDNLTIAYLLERLQTPPRTTASG